MIRVIMRLQSGEFEDQWRERLDVLLRDEVESSKTQDATTIDGFSEILYRTDFAFLLFIKHERARARTIDAVLVKRHNQHKLPR